MSGTPCPEEATFELTNKRPQCQTNANPHSKDRAAYTESIPSKDDDLLQERRETGMTDFDPKKLYLTALEAVFPVGEVSTIPTPALLMLLDQSTYSLCSTGHLANRPETSGLWRTVFMGNDVATTI